MARFIRFFGLRLKRLLHARVPLPSPTIGRLMAGLSVLGVLGLGYLLGAAVLFFQLPSHEFLGKAFAGAKAWHERGRASMPSISPGAAESVVREVTVDDVQKTYDGFTLYTEAEDSRATLIDMRGTEVHHWELPFSKAWPQAPHVKDPLPDGQIHWFRARLYPNGDLLAIYHGDGDTPYGYGLVKLDKDSKLLWAYANHVHHDVDVGEDGTIYTLTQNLVEKPPAGLGFIAAPNYLAEFLVVLSPEGQELESIPIMEAFANSPYALTLFSAGKFMNPMSNVAGPNVALPLAALAQQNLKGDLLHTNSVRVLSQAWAAKFPLFKAGQVLLSVRNTSTVAVLDRPTRRVVWAAQGGVWWLQHDAEFLDNGHLLLFDNCGSSRQTRILEYDPLTQAIPWVYANEDSMAFNAFARGMKQRLPNGNTLILDPDNRRLFEVTQSKDLVWENLCSLPSGSPDQVPGSHPLTSARRYSADELTFLKDVARPRP
jgi:hypothetical protein